MKKLLGILAAICVVALAIFAALPTLKVHARTTPTCEELNGAVLYSDEDNPAYLGFFGAASAVNSIMNRNGPHGDSISAYSVRNKFSIYGDAVNKFSALNIYAQRAPIIVTGAKIIGRLTARTLTEAGILLSSIDLNCTFTALKHDTSRPLPGAAPWFIASDGEYTDKVLLRWGDAPGATAYVVTVSGGNLLFPILFPEANYTSLAVVGLKAGVKYQFGVRALNQVGPGSYVYDFGFMGVPGEGTPTNTPGAGLGITPVGSPIPPEGGTPNPSSTPTLTPSAGTPTPPGTPGVVPNETVTPVGTPGPDTVYLPVVTTH